MTVSKACQDANVSSKYTVNSEFYQSIHKTFQKKRIVAPFSMSAYQKNTQVFPPSK